MDESGELRLLAPPRYDDEERSMIVHYVMALRADAIRAFMKDHDVPASGPKRELRERLGEHVAAEDIPLADLVQFLDSVTPWGKQHVFLYHGNPAVVSEWRREAEVVETLKRHRVHKYLNAKLPLILPKELALSSIEYAEGRHLRVFSVERREYYERRNDMDEEREHEGRVLDLRAYLTDVTRGLAVFEWNLVSNEAELRITQLPSGCDYEGAEQAFARLTRPWLDLAGFAKLDIQAAIKRLGALESQSQPEARSHEIGIRTAGGRTVSAQSPTSTDSVFGEAEVDAVVDTVREHGVGHLGNFYWLGSAACPRNGNPLEKELHTILVGDKNRINFTAPNRPQDVRYVLSRVRALSH